MWILLSKFPPKTSSCNALPRRFVTARVKLSDHTPSWECTRMSLLYTALVWGHPASQQLQVCLLLRLLPLIRPWTPEESTGLLLPSFPTQETFCFSHLYLQWWFINVQHSPETNTEEERGKERCGGRDIPTGTQISGSKRGLKACPIFKGQLEVIIIQLCDSFLCCRFFLFLSQGTPYKSAHTGLRFSLQRRLLCGPSAWEGPLASDTGHDNKRHPLP